MPAQRLTNHVDIKAEKCYKPRLKAWRDACRQFKKDIPWSTLRYLQQSKVKLDALFTSADLNYIKEEDLMALLVANLLDLTDERYLQAEESQKALLVASQWDPTDTYFLQIIENNRLDLLPLLYFYKIETFDPAFKTPTELIHCAMRLGQANGKISRYLNFLFEHTPIELSVSEEDLLRIRGIEMGREIHRKIGEALDRIGARAATEGQLLAAIKKDIDILSTVIARKPVIDDANHVLSAALSTKNLPMIKMVINYLGITPSVQHIQQVLRYSTEGQDDPLNDKLIILKALQKPGTPLEGADLASYFRDAVQQLNFTTLHHLLSLHVKRPDALADSIVKCYVELIKSIQPEGQLPIEPPSQNISMKAFFFTEGWFWNDLTYCDSGFSLSQFIVTFLLCSLLFAIVGHYFYFQTAWVNRLYCETFWYCPTGENNTAVNVNLTCYHWTQQCFADVITFINGTIKAASNASRENVTFSYLTPQPPTPWQLTAPTSNLTNTSLPLLPSDRYTKKIGRNLMYGLGIPFVLTIIFLLFNFISSCKNLIALNLSMQQKRKRDLATNKDRINRYQQSCISITQSFIKVLKECKRGAIPIEHHEISRLDADKPSVFDPHKTHCLHVATLFAKHMDERAVVAELSTREEKSLARKHFF